MIAIIGALFDFATGLLRPAGDAKASGHTQFAPGELQIPQQLSEFDPRFAREMLLLIGNAYVEYFATRYGPRPEQWKPASARANYSAYLPAELPEQYRPLCTINLIGGETRWPIGRMLLHSSGARVIAFRGTVSEDEWVKDILIMQSDAPFAPEVDSGIAADTRVHTGFARMFQQLDPPPDAWAEYLDEPHDAPLILCGHSLGGALATLAAVQLHKRQPRLLTFGAPRVGNPAFADRFQQLIPPGRALRIVNHWDPIHELPDEDVDLFFREYKYRHAGPEHRVYSLSQHGGPSLAKIITENESWRDWLETIFDSDQRLDPLFAHQLRAYEHACVRVLA